MSRGKDFRVIGRFSLLGDAYLSPLITNRCRRIIRFTEGREPISGADARQLRKSNDDWATWWGGSAQKTITEKDSKIRELLKLMRIV